MTGPDRKVLFVDDERRILDALKRQFHGRFMIETANDTKEALQFLHERGPYAVIVSDLRMPGMGGLEFLTQAKTIAPDAVRIMLTGHADTAAAIGAINQGNIFRFLMKPCFGDILAKTLEDGIRQHELILSERVLLEETLHGAVRMLAEIVSMLSPAVFSQTHRIRVSVKRVVQRLKLQREWRFDVAAMLCHIGCVTVPPAILARVAQGETLNVEEARIFASHPETGWQLLTTIPRLAEVAEMILRQNEPCTDPGEALDDDVVAGARMLMAAIDLDKLEMSGVESSDAIAQMALTGIYNPHVLGALPRPATAATLGGKAFSDIAIDKLKPGMIVDQDVLARNGVLLLARGQEVTEHAISRLVCFQITQGVVEPIRVSGASPLPN